MNSPCVLPSRILGDLDLVRSRLAAQHARAIGDELVRETGLQDGGHPGDADPLDACLAAEEAILAALRDDGLWPDIDYADRSLAIWQPLLHLQRLGVIAWRLAKERDAERRGHRILRLRAGIDAWLRLDPRSDNLWQNAIGAPSAILRILTLSSSHIPTAHRTLLLAWTRRGIDSAGRWDYHGVPTGQNLVWLAGIHLQRAALEGDAAELERAVAGLGTELEARETEGIQDDWTFHQHGAQLYSGGYGRGFTVDLANYAEAVAGTPFAFPSAELDVLASYLLDGQRWLVQGRTFDFTSLGRELSRPEAGDASCLRQACLALADAGHRRAAELRAFADHLDTGAGAMPEGNRMFWRSDLMVHRRRGLYAAVKLSSHRTVGGESGNGENLRGWHLADGVLTVGRDGREHHGIFPLWDWTRVPGTTARPGRTELPELGWHRSGQHTPWAGGASTGSDGLLSFIHRRDGIEARKTWFFIDRTVIGLIAGLAVDGGGPIETTLAQCRLRGAVTVLRDGEDPRDLAHGVHLLEGPVGVRHDGCLWRVPLGVALRIEHGPRSGSWEAISRSQVGQGCCDGVFCLGIVHAGLRPASWRLDVADLSGQVPISDEDRFETVANDAGRQIVWDAACGIIYAACYEPGGLPRTGLAVDRPCVGICSPGERRLILADPARAARSIVLSAGDARPGRTIQLPTDPRCSQVLVEL